MKIEELDALAFYLDGAVSFEDLTRFDWRRQTDVVQELFVAAMMFTELGKRAVFIDGHINQSLKIDAKASGDIRGFFNKRCHMYGLKGQRLIVYDTVTTNEMGGRGSSALRLHFHGIFEKPEGWKDDDLYAVLEKVFGRAAVMGQRQFHKTLPNWANHFTFGGVQVHGPLGKLMYAIKHSGAAYLSLGLNEEGKRSRKAPASRRACNREARRLAKSNPSHFNRAVVFFDRVSKQAGEAGFDAWVQAERDKRNHSPERLPVELAIAV